MQKRKLGKCNLEVSAIGLGCMGLSFGLGPAVSKQDGVGLIRAAFERGVTFFDTAEIYGNGDAEKLIGHVIAGQREHVILVSKVWPTHVAGDGIQRACEGSLARLGTDYLDLYLLHWPNGITDLAGRSSGL